MSHGLFNWRSRARIGMLLLVPIALVLVLKTKVWAEVTLKSWTPGETLTAADLNANFNSIKAELGTASAPNPWFPCGVLMDIVTGSKKCELNAYHADAYEYGIVWNSVEPFTVDCLTWNLGQRVVNRHPYMVDSDNPPGGTMQLGGFIFYTGTQASDDDIPSSCPADRWRHSYWKIVGGSVQLFNTQGCFNQPLYCRARR